MGDSALDRETIVVVVVGVLIVGSVLGFVVVSMQSSGASLQGELSVRWVSETGRNVSSNHHAPAVAMVAGEPMVFAPISGLGHHHDGGAETEHEHGDATSGCALVGLNGSDGSVEWRNRVPVGNCTIHSVADPVVEDLVGGPRVEVLAATTEDAVKAFAPLSGDVLFRYALSSYGYSQPIVANVTGDQGPELIVVDVRGSVFVVRANGSTIWSDLHESYTWGQPRLDDFNGDRGRELFVALGNGTMLLYDVSTGTVEWRKRLPGSSSITWTAAGNVDDDPGAEVVVATVGGEVRLYDGASGDRQWRVNLGRFAAVRAVGDGDDDGVAEVYAVARDGVLTSLNARTGATEWSQTVTDSKVPMMPPPTLGDVDGDGDPELVAVTNDGQVKVMAPETGEVLASYSRSEQIRIHAVLGNLDDDSATEIIVMYGNGQVVALDYASDNG